MLCVLVLEDMIETKINGGSGMAKRFNLGASINPLVVPPFSDRLKRIKLNLAQRGLL